MLIVAESEGLAIKMTLFLFFMDILLGKSDFYILLQKLFQNGGNFIIRFIFINHYAYGN